jgi:hypothetical protein
MDGEREPWQWYAMPTLRWDGCFDMADHRRCYVPGGSFFFTVVTEPRAALLGDDLSQDSRQFMEKRI